jgi:competence protein ComEC
MKAFESLLLSILCCCSSVAFAGKSDGKLDIYWIDSEGGGSTLIVTPSDASVLIDSGNPGGRDSARIHKVASEVAGLKRLDHYVTTHFHVDHFGGAAEVAKLLPIENVWDNGIPEKDPDGNPADTRWLLMSKPYREMQVGKRNIITPGQTIPLTSANQTKISLRCLAAKQRFISASSGTNQLCDQAEQKPKDTSDRKTLRITPIASFCCSSTAHFDFSTAVI